MQEPTTTSVVQEALRSDERWHTKDISDAVHELAAPEGALTKLPGHKGFVCTNDRHEAQPLQPHELRYRELVRYIEENAPLLSKEDIDKRFADNKYLGRDLQHLCSIAPGTPGALEVIEPHLEGLTGFAKSSKWYVLAGGKAAAMSTLRAKNEDTQRRAEDNKRALQQQITKVLEETQHDPIKQRELLERAAGGATSHASGRSKTSLRGALEALHANEQVYKFDGGGFVLTQYQEEAERRSRPAHEQRRSALFDFVLSKGSEPVSLEEMAEDVTQCAASASFGAASREQIRRDTADLVKQGQLTLVSGTKRERRYVAAENEAAGLERCRELQQRAQTKTQGKVRESSQRRQNIIQFLKNSSSVPKSLDDVVDELTRAHPGVDAEALKLRIRTDLRKMLKETNPEIVALGPERSPHRKYAHCEHEEAAKQHLQDQRQQKTQRVKGVRLSAEQVGFPAACFARAPNSRLGRTTSLCAMQPPRRLPSTSDVNLLIFLLRAENF